MVMKIGIITSGVSKRFEKVTVVFVATKEIIFGIIVWPGSGRSRVFVDQTSDVVHHISVVAVRFNGVSLVKNWSCSGYLNNC